MRTNGALLAALAAVTLTACGSTQDPATELYGTTFGASQLVQLDPSTGALVRVIGPVGYRVNGLAYDQTSGTLYATTSAYDTRFPDGLIEIDRATGAGTPIGAGAGRSVMTPTVNGAGALFAWTEPTDDLVRIDKTTGVATVVGESGLSTATHGLAFDPRDRLVFVNWGGEVYTLDAATGAPTLDGQLPLDAGFAHHGDFHPDTGLYWGVDETGYGSRNLVVADLASLEVKSVLPTVNDLFAITFKK